MFRLISPRQLADAIGVSESSLKRWADAGKITVTRTDGGHRRITITEAVRFIRETKSVVLRPDLLGLPSNENAVDAALTQLLIDGNGKAAIAAITARFLAGNSIAAICDGPLRAAMTHMGNLWRHSDDGVMIEHRATAICIDALGTLKSLLPDDSSSATAVGCAPSGDPYVVPSMMCAAALTEVGMRAVNLGAETPFESLRQACEAEKASLCWISTSSPPSAESRSLLAAFMDDVSRLGVTVVIGGRHRDALAAVAPQARAAGTIGELVAIAEDTIAHRAILKPA